MGFEFKDKYDVYDLKELVAVLRSPEGCPWDMEQTHKSIRRNFIEEAYEAAEAIDENDPEHLKEEIGDVLLQVVFHAGIEEDAGRFTLDDAADAACRKMIFRHPHIFGSEKFETSAQVLDMWEEVKKAEKQYETETDVLKAVAKSLPATWRAEKIQKKAEKAGYMQIGFEKSLFNVTKAAETLTVERNKDEQSRIIGEMLFAAVNAARLLGIDVEEALTLKSERYIDEFEKAEKTAK